MASACVMSMIFGHAEVKPSKVTVTFTRNGSGVTVAWKSICTPLLYVRSQSWSFENLRAMLERRELGNGHVPGPGTHHLHVRLDAALHLEEEVGERIEAARRVLVLDLDLDLLDERVLHDLHIVASLGDFRLAGLGEVSFHAKGPGHTRNTARRGEREARRSEAEVAVDVLRHLDGHP